MWLLWKEGRAAIGTDAQRGPGGRQGSLSPPAIHYEGVVCLLINAMHLFCAGLSVCALFWSTKFSFNESTWGSHYTYSLSGIWLWGVSYNKICLSFLVKRSPVIPAGNAPVGLSGGLVKNEKEKRVDFFFIYKFIYLLTYLLTCLFWAALGLHCCTWASIDGNFLGSGC